MKKNNSQLEELTIKLKRDYIKENLLEAYKNILNGSDIKAIIKGHKKVIDSMVLKGKNKNKYKTLKYLEQYRDTYNKDLALANLTNALNNKSLFRYFLSDEEKIEKRWKDKGSGRTL